MSKKLIKDIKSGDVCFFVHNTGITRILKCQNIKKKKSCKIDYYEITFVTEYNSLQKYCEFGECNSIAGIDHGIFLTKEDAIDYINTIQNNFEHSKELIKKN